MAVNVSTDAGKRGSQGTASLRSTISAEEVWWYGVPYPTPEKLYWGTSPAPFWHHTCCPHFSARQRSAAHSSCYCWLSSQPERNSAPLPSKSPDLYSIEPNRTCRMIWIDACAVVNQHPKLCSRLLSKNEGEFRKTVVVDWSSLCRDGSVLCYRLMVGTTYIDFEMTSSERYGL